VVPCAAAAAARYCCSCGPRRYCELAAAAAAAAAWNAAGLPLASAEMEEKRGYQIAVRSIYREYPLPSRMIASELNFTPS